MTSLLLLLIGGISHVFLMFLVIKLVLHLDLGNCKRKDFYFYFLSNSNFLFDYDGKP